MKPSTVLTQVFGKKLEQSEDIFIKPEQLRTVQALIKQAEEALEARQQNKVSTMALDLKLSKLNNSLDIAEIKKLIGVLETLEMHIRDLGAHTDDDFVVFANAAIEQAKRHIS